MARQYQKIEYRAWNPALNIEDAIAAGDYAKLYYLDADRIGRVDEFYRDTGLLQIIYREVLPPFDSLLMEHFTAHPDVPCEIVTPLTEMDGVAEAMSYQYTAPTVIHVCHRLHFDARMRLVRSIELDQDGKPLGEMRYCYDAAGKLTREEIVSPAGHLLSVHNLQD